MIVALALQVTSLGYGAVRGQNEGTTQAVAALGVLCHAGGTGHDPAAPHHDHRDCTLCPLCQSLTAPVAILTPPPGVPAPRRVVVASNEVLPPPTGPPGRFVAAASARGPPSTV